MGSFPSGDRRRIAWLTSGEGLMRRRPSRRQTLARRSSAPCSFIREALPLCPLDSSSLFSLCALIEAHRPPCQTRTEISAARVARRRSCRPSAALRACDGAPARRLLAPRASDADDSICLVIAVTAEWRISTRTQRRRHRRVPKTLRRVDPRAIPALWSAPTSIAWLRARCPPRRDRHVLEERVVVRIPRTRIGIRVRIRAVLVSFLGALLPQRAFGRSRRALRHSPAWLFALRV